MPLSFKARRLLGVALVGAVVVTPDVEHDPRAEQSRDKATADAGCSAAPRRGRATRPRSRLPTARSACRRSSVRRWLRLGGTARRGIRSSPGSGRQRRPACGGTARVREDRARSIVLRNGTAPSPPSEKRVMIGSVAGRKSPGPCLESDSSTPRASGWPSMTYSQMHVQPAAAVMNVQGFAAAERHFARLVLGTDERRDAAAGSRLEGSMVVDFHENVVQRADQRRVGVDQSAIVPFVDESPVFGRSSRCGSCRAAGSRARRRGPGYCRWP